MLTDKVLDWCRTQRLLAPGDAVTVALSGGADSVALLHVLLHLPLSLTVSAAHFNHHLRGAESDRDETFCRDLCASWNVPLRCGGADVSALAQQWGTGVETAARRVRYDFFGSSETIATAHHSDDNLETLLLHLTRGSALRGLGGIPPRRDNIIRPLLCANRQEILDYLAEYHLPHVEDGTNTAPLCGRNRLRLDVIPALYRENPAVSRAALSTSLLLREDEALLEDLAHRLLQTAASAEGWQVAPLLEAPRPLRLRALRQLLEEAGANNLSLRHLEAVEALLTAGPSSSLDLPSVTLRRQYDLLCTTVPVSVPLDPAPLPLGGVLPFPDGRTLRCDGPHPYVPGPGLHLVLDAPPLVRSRRPGDRLHHSGGTKSVKALLIDKKIPAPLRDGIPVLEVDGRVVAVWGVGADPAFLPRPGQRCYTIHLYTKEGEVQIL
ncbi:tRNA lysidine(34) synthetase TilS [Candidatus Avoscillospira sp. LCP25S3_F1]|uniref:tRNA lysidine(34) synthetase TilS n=1 Tax=Candidatus Avoscillospira sp. LCP25S3_F1 TaxID=3438825 RepID=UPI003F8EFC00